MPVVAGVVTRWWGELGGELGYGVGAAVDRLSEPDLLLRLHGSIGAEAAFEPFSIGAPQADEA